MAKVNLQKMKKVMYKLHLNKKMVVNSEKFDFFKLYLLPRLSLSLSLPFQYKPLYIFQYF
jgi:hypothetical protein